MLLVQRDMPFPYWKACFVSGDTYEYKRRLIFSKLNSDSEERDNGIGAQAIGGCLSNNTYYGVGGGLRLMGGGKKVPTIYLPADSAEIVEVTIDESHVKGCKFWLSMLYVRLGTSS